MPLATLLLLLLTPSRWRAGEEKAEGMVENEDVEKAPGDKGGIEAAGIESDEGATGCTEGDDVDELWLMIASVVPRA